MTDREEICVVEEAAESRAVGGVEYVKIPWPEPNKKLPFGEAAKLPPASANGEPGTGVAEPSAAILNPAIFVAPPAYTNVLAAPPLTLQAVEKLHVYGAASGHAAGSANCSLSL